LPITFSRSGPVGVSDGTSRSTGAGSPRVAVNLADIAGGHADRTIGQRMREYTRPLVFVTDDG
jgi:hypothetical protein